MLQRTLVKNVHWKEFPQPRYEHGKFCNFISCPDSVLPIRDYIHEEKLEPNYETSTYNVFDSCNQSAVSSLIQNQTNNIIFFTKYQGSKEEYRDKVFITGLFYISEYGIVGENKETRIALRSRGQNGFVVLSIDDALLLDQHRWQRWFNEDIPMNKYGTILPRAIKRRLTNTDTALLEILDHFSHKPNRIEEYRQEIRAYKKKHKNISAMM